MTTETVLSIFLGIGLAAAVGFRVFLPLFGLSLAAYFGFWEVNSEWEWIGSLAALITLGVATLVELFAYFIPWVDNLLDTIALPLGAFAGTAVMVATLADLDPLVTWSLAIIAGGGTATAIRGAAAGSRLVSTGSTGGLANPVVSSVETGAATTVTLATLLSPVLGFILVMLVLLLIFAVYRKLRPRTNNWK